MSSKNEDTYSYFHKRVWSEHKKEILIGLFVNEKYEYSEVSKLLDDFASYVRKNLKQDDENYERLQILFEEISGLRFEFNHNAMILKRIKKELPEEKNETLKENKRWSFSPTKVKANFKNFMSKKKNTDDSEQTINSFLKNFYTLVRCEFEGVRLNNNNNFVKPKPF